MHLRENARCTFCGCPEDTIEHVFGGCQTIVLSNFILDVEQRILGRQFIVRTADVFFGYKLKPSDPLNFLIFHLKYYIFSKENEQWGANAGWIQV